MKYLLIIFMGLLSFQSNAEFDLANMFSGMSKMMKMAENFQQQTSQFSQKMNPKAHFNTEKPAYMSNITGTWQGKNGIVMILNAGMFELLGQEKYMTGVYMLYQDRLIIYIPQADRVHLYQYAVQNQQMILRDALGRMIRYVKR